ncbi:ribosomal protein S18 acetylase RimI-like enzyme [Aneurinibacillus soli]|uniref:Ribosomal-protein-alanine N-acetyltransferase n=1 Tax=Aneurinibacillus soli TaxID=1500254 RepID=A0A0U5B967_9BACL|nr:GNAT family N-acetyltransferase [Aneurinibacillus soli]PYE60853.1 ribosomal protein S18 acetylase RimI-like enzyme [Aneurinibacillus soli]BAU26759.1 ribosomal-protein-alanine N-acetyltransferase [Aneurinibacillus soli]
MFEHVVTLRTVEEVDETILLHLFFNSSSDLQNMPIPDDAKSVLVRQQFLAEQYFLKTHFPDADVCVIFLNEQPIGRLNVHRGQEAYRILAIALLPEFRSMGIGRSLLEDILQEAAKCRKKVCLQVAWHNGLARALYERLGFEMVEDKGVYCEMQWTP